MERVTLEELTSSEAFVLRQLFTLQVVPLLIAMNPLVTLHAGISFQEKSLFRVAWSHLVFQRLSHMALFPIAWI
jgi:hypothetical protein